MVCRDVFSRWSYGRFVVLMMVGRLLGNVGGDDDERGDVRVGMGWGWDVIFDMFFNVFNINILFTFIFVWCVA